MPSPWHLDSGSPTTSGWRYWWSISWRGSGRTEAGTVIHDPRRGTPDFTKLSPRCGACTSSEPQQEKRRATRPFTRPASSCYSIRSSTRGAPDSPSTPRLCSRITRPTGTTTCCRHFSSLAELVSRPTLARFGPGKPLARGAERMAAGGPCGPGGARQVRRAAASRPLTGQTQPTRWSHSMPYVSARTRTSDSQPAPGSMTQPARPSSAAARLAAWSHLGVRSSGSARKCPKVHIREQIPARCLGWLDSEAYRTRLDASGVPPEERHVSDSLSY